MKPIRQSFHFSQHSWLSFAKQYQRLRRDWLEVCLALGVPQGAQCGLEWQSPVLTVRCGAALAVKLRQIAPDMVEQLVLKSWGEVSLVFAVERSASALHQAWQAQQAPWVNPNETRYGKRSPPSRQQKAALTAALTRMKTVEK